MGLFVLPPTEDSSPEELIETAIDNLELHLIHTECAGHLYLIQSFAIPQLKEALEKLKKD